MSKDIPLGDSAQGEHQEAEVLVSIPKEFDEAPVEVSTTTTEDVLPESKLLGENNWDQVHVIITDLDETLWLPGECCPPENIEMTRILKEAGIPLVLATGRTLKAACRGLERFGLKEHVRLFPGVYSDGGLIYGESENDIILDNRLTYDQIQLAKKYAEEVDPDTICGFSFDEGQGFTSSADFAELTGCKDLTRWDENVLELPKNPGNEFWAEHGCYFLVVHSHLLSVSEPQQSKYIQQVQAIGCEAVVFQDYKFLLVKPAGVDKASALKTLIKHYGWEEKDCLFIGDGANDISAMKELPVTVCMRNGVSQALSAAKYITNQRVENGGWAETVLKVTQQARADKAGLGN